MDTIGHILQEARLSKNMSLKKLEYLTKIKSSYIHLIEINDWEKLPDFPVVSGFVKNISSLLGVPVNKALAILKRDYLPKKLMINPMPDVVKKFVWSPKITFIVAVGGLFILVVGYLLAEFIRFSKSPELIVIHPSENEIVHNTKIKVEGKTTTDAVLTVNNQPITLDQDGKFITEIEINQDTKEIKFIATSRSGKKTEIIRQIKVE